MNASHAVILVDSTSHALRIEKLFQASGLACKLIPVPRHLSSDCGVCVRCNSTDVPLIHQVLDDARAPYHSIEIL